METRGPSPQSPTHPWEEFALREHGCSLESPSHLRRTLASGFRHAGQDVQRTLITTNHGPPMRNATQVTGQKQRERNGRRSWIGKLVKSARACGLCADLAQSVE